MLNLNFRRSIEQFVRVFIILTDMTYTNYRLLSVFITFFSISCFALLRKPFKRWRIQWLKNGLTKLSKHTLRCELLKRTNNNFPWSMERYMECVCLCVKMHFDTSIHELMKCTEILTNLDLSIYVLFYWSTFRFYVRFLYLCVVHIVYSSFSVFR